MQGRELQIELFPYERRSLETLEREFGVERKTIVGFAQSLNALRKVFEEVVGGGGEEFRAGRIVIMGLINYAHQLFAGGLLALETVPEWGLAYADLKLISLNGNGSDHFPD